jgi:predicted DsbA family dithiol-disulfide isomerase
VGDDRSASVFDQATWAIRCAFFRDCRDISRWDVQCDIARSAGVEIAAIEELIQSGVAFARLAADKTPTRCGSKEAQAWSSMRDVRSFTETSDFG